MRILVACEESQAVTKELRRLGHEAYSCDIQPCSGGHPEWHLQVDALELLKMAWDMLIAFPPCTDLAVSGARWFPEKRADGRQQRSIDFFMRFVRADCPRIAIENPVGIMSTEYRKPSQIIQPWMFGHGETKATCLWLKGLPPLVAMMEAPVEPQGLWVGSTSARRDPTIHQRYILHSNRDQKRRSKTFPGIAKAMAEQWAGDIRKG